MKFVLTEQELKRYIIEAVDEISTQLKTNAMLGSFDKARKSTNDAGMRMKKTNQGNRMYSDLEKELNTVDVESSFRKRCYYRDETIEIFIYVDPYELQTNGSQIRGVVSVRAKDGTHSSQFYQVVYDIDDHSIVEENESDGMENSLRFVSEKGVVKYNVAKKKIRDLVIGFANRKGGPVGQYKVGNDTKIYPKIGDAMRASIEGGQNTHVNKVQPLR